MELNNLGFKLAELRKKHNLTQREMADKLNVSNQLISKWETEQVIPGVEYLVKISEIFDVSLDELVLGKKHKTKSEKNRFTNFFSTMGRKIKTFVLTHKKKLLYSLIAVCSALFITAISLLSVYVFVPATHKQAYITDIGQSFYNYIEENNSFQIKIIGKRDGSTITTQYLNGNIDENGIDYEVYGDMFNANENIIDNVVYNRNYKTEYTGNIVTIKELVDQKLASDITSLLEEYDYDQIPINHLRKTSSGYFIKIDGNILRNQLTEEEKKNIFFDGDLQGDVIIKNGIIEKIDLSITMRDKDSKRYDVRTLMEFLKEKPSFSASDTPWYHDETISTSDFIAKTFSDYNSVDITTDSETHQRMVDAILGGKIRHVNGNLWFTYHLSGLSKTYLVAINTATGTIDYDQEIYNDYGFFYQDNFVVYDSAKLKMINLKTQAATETSFGRKDMSYYDTRRIIAGDYLIIQNSPASLDPVYYLIYDLKNNLVLGKTSNLANDEGTFSTNVIYKNNILYYMSNDYNYGYDSDVIYSFNFETKTETKLVSSTNGLIIRYIDNQGNLYYQDYGKGAIFKVGSTFAYAVGTVYEENGLLYIVYGDELYVYNGEQLISQTTYTPPEQSIFDHKDVLFIDKENNLVYLKGKNVVYRGSLDLYYKMADIWLVNKDNGQLKSPYIVDCVEDYVIAKINSAGTQYGIYKRLDLSRAYKVSNLQEDVTTGNYARISFEDDTQIVLIGNEIYLLSQKSA